MSVVTTTTTTSAFWLFLPTIFLSIIISYVKCKSYRCSIKYGLLTGAIIGVAYGIIVWLLLIPPQLAEISANTGHDILFVVITISIIFEVLGNIVMGLFGSLIPVFLKKSLKRVE